MGDRTKIPWCDATWNPVVGCSPVSAGCRHCYAARFASRFAGPGQSFEGIAAGGRWTGTVRLNEKRLLEPRSWKQPRRIFVCSMGDLFAAKADDVTLVFEHMAMMPQHTFLVLTKRPDRIYPVLYGEEGGWFLGGGDYHSNVWLGVSVEDQGAADERIPILLRDAWPHHTFVSIEPMLSPVELAGPTMLACHGDKPGDDARHPEWIIAGGESGPGFRPMDLDWIRSLRDQCARARIPFFYKQPAGIRPGGDATLDGRTHREFPAKEKQHGDTGT